MSTAQPRLVVVAGSGRSGTSSMAGLLKHLGLVIPQPEVEGNRSNPRGFFEPRWVVDFQGRLLRQAQVRLTDARPDAFPATTEAGASPEAREELRAWLAPQLTPGGELVIKDPRSSWFLPMWQEVPRAGGAAVGFVLMLRQPAEVVGSKAEYYKNKGAGRGRRQVQITRVAGWLNICLFGELHTRGTDRVFVRYTDLLDDWRPAVRAVGHAFDLGLRHGIDIERAAAVDAFLDPDLHRVRTGWDELDLPPGLQDLAEEAWDLLNALVDAGGHDGEVERRLDAVRARYVTMYADAEALVQSTIDLPGRRQPGQRSSPEKPAEPPAAPTRRAASVSALRRRLRAGDR